MKTSIALGALAALAFAGAALAQGEPGGKMTLAQAEQHSLERLQRADANHDGKVSKAEFMAAVQQRMAARGGVQPPVGFADQMFARQDVNGDGFITQEEVKASTAQTFARLDPNHTGYVDMSQMRGGMRHGG